MKFLRLLLEEDSIEELKATVVKLEQKIYELEKEEIQYLHNHVFDLITIRNIGTNYKTDISESIIKNNKLILEDIVEIGSINKNGEKELNDWVKNFYIYFNTLKKEKLGDWIIELSEYIDVLKEETEKKESNNKLKKTQIIGNESLVDLKSIIVKLTDQLSKLKINITSINKNNREELTIYNNKMQEYAYNIIENIKKDMVEEIDLLYTIANTKLSGEDLDIVKIFIEELKNYFNRLVVKK